jgi:hypothetical protein
MWYFIMFYVNHDKNHASAAMKPIFVLQLLLTFHWCWLACNAFRSTAHHLTNSYHFLLTRWFQHQKSLTWGSEMTWHGRVCLPQSKFCSRKPLPAVPLYNLLTSIRSMIAQKILMLDVAWSENVATKLWRLQLFVRSRFSVVSCASFHWLEISLVFLQQNRLFHR